MAKRGRPTNAEREARAAEVQFDSSQIGQIMATAVRDNVGGVATALAPITRERIIEDDVYRQAQADQRVADEARRYGLDVDALGAQYLGRAPAELGLLPEHVASSRVYGESLVIVTKGGTKLRWPQDIERAKTLTQSQKDGQFPGGVNLNSKAWHEPAEKNAALAATLAAQQKAGE
jgi:hypothetical protein